MSRIVVADSEGPLAKELSLLLGRFGDRVVWVRRAGEAQQRLKRSGADLLVVDEGFENGRPLEHFSEQLAARQPPVVLLVGPQGLNGLVPLYAQGIAHAVIKPYHPRELLSCLQAAKHRQRRVVCLGGGTGLYTLLLGLKLLPDVHLTAIVNMSDDGGSTGRIREAFGILPPGDIRRSLVALSTAPALMNELMQYRFAAGAGLKDHNVGNLLLAAVSDLTGSMAQAVRAMGDILTIQGVVLPVTETLNTLLAEFEDGRIVRGEHHIDVPDGRDHRLRIRRLWHEPAATATDDALSALLAADAITIGPGDLFTSVLSTVLADGIGPAVAASRARTVYLCNLMTKPGETSGFCVSDHAREIVRALGGDALDDLIVSNTPLSEDAVALYRRKDQQPVRLDAEALSAVTAARLVPCDIGSERDLVRHDSVKLANELARLLTLTPVPAVAGANGDGERPDDS